MLAHASKTSGIDDESQPAGANSAMAERPRNTPTSGAPLPYCLGGRPRPLGKRHRPAMGNQPQDRDRKSTRLNSSHVAISYAVFCLKKKKSPLRGRFFLLLTPALNCTAEHRQVRLSSSYIDI